MPNILVQILLIYILAISMITLVISWADKRAAVKDKQRIPESTLIMLSILGGSFGMLLSMKLFRHKTLKRKFTIGIPAIIILQIAGFLYLWYIMK